MEHKNQVHLCKIKTHNNLTLTTTNPQITSIITEFINRIITYKPNVTFIMEIADDSQLCPILCIYKSFMYISKHSFNFDQNFYFYINLAIRQKEQLINEKNVYLEEWEDSLIRIMECISRKEKPLDIFIEHSSRYPNDLLSFKLGMVMGLSCGDKKYLQILAENYNTFQDNHRDSGFIGIYSFILEELKMFKESEEIVIKGMKIDPDNIWIQHVYTHILYQTNRIEESIVFLESKENQWQTEASCFLNKHIRWHLAISYLEEKEYCKSNATIESIILMSFDEAECPLSILGYIIRLFIRTNSLSLIDNFNWIEILLEYLENTQIYTKHLLFDAFSVWLVSFICSRKLDLINKYNPQLLLDSICKQIKFNVFTDEIQNSDRNKYFTDVYLPIIEAMILFGQGNYRDCLSLLYLKINMIWNIGASEEQLFPLYEIILYCCAQCDDQDKFRYMMDNIFTEGLSNLHFISDLRKKLS